MARYSQRLRPARAWRVLPLLIVLLLWGWLGTGERHADQGQPLAPDALPRGAIEDKSGRSPELLVLLGLSGGGTRAAALSYGVFEELAATIIDTNGGPRRLLDEVDVISSVSGGSFVNAYYGLHGDRLFDDFKERMLLQPIEDALARGLLTPRNWRSLASDHYGRSDMAAAHYDSILFDGLSFGDIDRSRAPWMIINATDLVASDRFVFTRNLFDALCIDLDRFSVARAVAASAAVPGAATPITLRNRAGECGGDLMPWLARPLAATDRPELQARARRYLDYGDIRKRPWIHLVDGGITDNLGLRQFYTFFVTNQDPQRRHAGIDNPALRHVLVISVNAAVDRDMPWTVLGRHPSEQRVLSAMTAAQMRQHTADTLQVVREKYERWGEQRQREGHQVSFNFVEVAFSGVADPDERHRLNNLPTSLQLEPQQVEQLIAAGRRLLAQSASYQRFVAAHRSE